MGQDAALKPFNSHNVRLRGMLLSLAEEAKIQARITRDLSDAEIDALAVVAVAGELG